MSYDDRHPDVRAAPRWRALLAAIGPERRDRRRRPPRPVAAARRRRRRRAGRARSGAAGPAAARNAGWRAARADWVAFLDDDVVPPRRLARRAGGRPGRARPGRRRDPGPHRRARAGQRPTDWERNVAGLERARWATADMAYRRDVLAAVGGFDERFPRAYREDADLGLRVTAAGWRIVAAAATSCIPCARPARGSR